MNYRRGLQRVYAVLTVAWVAIILLVVAPSFQFRRWSGAWESTYDHFPSSDPPTKIYLQQFGLLPLHSWLLAIGIALIPPLIGYWLWFHVSRWVYRGFRLKL